MASPFAATPDLLYDQGQAVLQERPRMGLHVLSDVKDKQDNGRLLRSHILVALPKWHSADHLGVRIHYLRRHSPNLGDE